MSFRFSGHETFPCRYTWLPKAFKAVTDDPRAFTDEERAMVMLGVGKNMLRAMRFWVQAAHIVAPHEDGGYAVTELGQRLLAENGYDPYLEDIRTLWVIHWQLSTQVEEPLFAWDYLLNRWQHPEINRSEVLRAFGKEAERQERKLSNVTLEQHFDVFLHTYVPTRSRKGDIQEDNLDSPLVELELIQKVGERKLDGTGKRESVYAFRRESKSEITPELFVYCLHDFWVKRHPNEKTLTFREVSVGHGSPGQIFKLPEKDIRERLDTLNTDSRGVFRYKESASQQLITRQDSLDVDLLANVYTFEELHA
jgi:Protein of unknown function (DUF4007)